MRLLGGIDEWTQIKQSEEPDWIESHKEMMTHQGRIMLKVWQRSDGYFFASATKPNGDRSITGLDAPILEHAQKEAERWARFMI